MVIDSPALERKPDFFVSLGLKEEKILSWVNNISKVNMTMKRKTVFIFSSIFIVFLFTACNKPVYKYNPDFEGKWRTIPVYDSLLNTTTGSEILIDGEDGSFQNSCNPCGADLCNCISHQIGKAVMNSSKTQMKIGSSSYPLSIDEEPNIDASGNWTMKIQGLRYYKQ